MATTSNIDAFFDSDDLMTWLLLNPELAEYDETYYSASSTNIIDVPEYDMILNSLLEPTSTTTDSNTTSSDKNNLTTTNNNNQTTQNVHKKNIPIKTGNNKKTTTSQKPLQSSKQIMEQFQPQIPIHNIQQIKSSNTSVTKLSRKRQRESIEDIEARVNELRNENADLQAHLMNVTQRTTEVHKQRIAMERLMVNKLNEINEHEENSDQSELASVVKQYTDIYADYGKCRQREVSFHLNQLEKLLLPTKTTKMSLWALQQDKSFFQKAKSPMFDLLSKELELTAEQIEKIQERREKVVNLLCTLQESLSLIDTLKDSIEKKHSSYDAICGRVQQACTPKQTVIFLRWIAAHADELTKYIPSFSRSIHHIPNVEFVDGVTNTTNNNINNISSNEISNFTSTFV